MSKPYDATFKQILDDYAADWVAWLAPRLGLPAGPYETLDPESSTVQVTPDKVFRLPQQAGLLHLEVQSSWDGELPDRLVEYNIWLHRRLGGPVHSLAILLRPEANSPLLSGELQRRRADGRPLLSFHYDVIRIWELSADQLLSSGLGLMPLGLLTNDALPRLPDLVQQFADRVNQEIDQPALRDRLLTEAFLLLGLRYDKEWIQNLFLGVQQMRESSTYLGILEEGVKKGRVEGRVQGRVEGRVEGRVDGLRFSLVTLLEQKFGQIPAELNARIQKTDDVAKLQSAIQQLLTLSAIDQLVL